MNRLRLPRPNLVDRLVGFVSPRAGLDRLRSRTALAVLSSYVDDTAGYAVGGQASRRAMRGWRPRASDANADTVPKLEASRASSRDLFMNTPIASAALRRVRTNVVGSGLTLQARLDRDLVGLPEEEADAWEKNVEREFNLWCESKDCDASRTLDFAGLQRLAFFSVLMNGDAFALLPYAPNAQKRETPYKLVVQLLEADRVATPPSSALDGLGLPGIDPKIVGGVEVDAFGAPVAYHVRKTASSGTLGIATDFERILSFGEKSGRRNVLHLLEVERIGQRRGMPYLANVIETLKQITRLSDAELMAAVIASFFTVFVKSTTGPGSLSSSFSAEESLLAAPDGTSGKDATHADNNVYEIGSGNIIELGNDQDVSIADPRRPNANFDPFFISIVKQIGASLELPYEELLLSFNSSYSASRAALIEAWKFYKERRRWLAANFCQPVYEAWLLEAISLGRISAPGFFSDASIRKAWSGTAWSGPGQGQIDPTKESQGALMRIAGNLSTFEDEYVEIKGGDWGSAMERRGRENRKLEELGLPTTVSPTGAPLPASGGTAPAREAPEEPPASAPTEPEDEED